MKTRLKTFCIWGIATFLLTSFGTLKAGGECCCEPCGVCCWDQEGFFVGADFLYWTVYQSDLDFAVDANVSAVTTVLGPGKVHYLDYDWDSGFRVEGGYRLGCEDWMGKVVYTYYRDTAKGSAKGSVQQELEATLLSPSVSFNPFREARGRNKLEYDVVDILIGKSLKFCDKTILTPFFGVRGLWLDQRLSVEYRGNSQLPTNGASLLSCKSEFEGAGIHAGMDFTYDLNCGLQVCGHFAGSVLAGRSKSHQLNVNVNENGSLSQVNVDISDHLDDSLIGWQMGIGGRYATDVWDCTSLVLSVGYEMTRWTDVPQLRRWNNSEAKGATNSPSNADILFHGLTLKADLLF